VTSTSVSVTAGLDLEGVATFLDDFRARVSVVLEASPVVVETEAAAAAAADFFAVTRRGT